jgi:hypothetical protein
MEVLLGRWRAGRTASGIMNAGSRILFFVLAGSIAATATANDVPTFLNSPRRKVSTAALQTPALHSSKKVPSLPPLPEGVEELKFADFFKVPVGPMGLELTERLKSLHGKKVRVLGFQVIESVTVCNSDPAAQNPVRKFASRFEAGVPGRLLLCATPQVVDFNHYGHAEDLPPQVLYVTVPEYYGQPTPHTPGMLLLTGTLDVGNKTEPDGRISVVRLILDPRPSPPSTPVASIPDAAAFSQTRTLKPTTIK